MGTDIHTWVTDKDGAWIEGNGNWVDACEYGSGKVFGCRSYALFGWLADVRNYSEVAPIASHRGWEGIPNPDELEYYFEDNYGHSWVSMEELNNIDYEQIICDKRYLPDGEEKTLRDFLYKGYFMDLEELNRIGADRVWFCFDS